MWPKLKHRFTHAVLGQPGGPARPQTTVIERLHRNCKRRRALAIARTLPLENSLPRDERRYEADPPLVESLTTLRPLRSARVQLQLPESHLSLSGIVPPAPARSPGTTRAHSPITGGALVGEPVVGAGTDHVALNDDDSSGC